MIIVSGEVRFAAGEIERLAPAMREAIEATRAEDGCLSYHYGRDALDPDLLIVSERWRDAASLDAHMKQPHLLHFIAAVGEAKVESMSVRMYPAGEGRILLGE